MPREKLRIAPRLRLEPCPSYYLRTARGYAFLSTFLESALEGDTLKTLHGLREGTPPERDPDLRTELHAIRDLFYGFYLLSAEDIGLKPKFLEGENINREQCEVLAARWLASFSTDPDLARDTRVSVPHLRRSLQKRHAALGDHRRSPHAAQGRFCPRTTDQAQGGARRLEHGLSGTTVSGLT